MTRGCGLMKICRLCPWKFTVEVIMLPQKDRQQVKKFMEFLQAEQKSNKAVKPTADSGGLPQR